MPNTPALKRMPTSLRAGRRDRTGNCSIQRRRVPPKTATSILSTRLSAPASLRDYRSCLLGSRAAVRSHRETAAGQRADREYRLASAGQPNQCLESRSARRCLGQTPRRSAAIPRHPDRDRTALPSSPPASPRALRPAQACAENSANQPLRGLTEPSERCPVRSRRSRRSRLSTSVGGRKTVPSSRQASSAAIRREAPHKPVAFSWSTIHNTP